MKKLIVFAILLFFASAFAEGLKGVYYCKIARSCELSDYTGEFTKNCKIIFNSKNNLITIYWEYGYNLDGDLVFCSNPKGGKNKWGRKVCTKVISSDIDKDDYGEEFLTIVGETMDHILGNDQLIMIFKINPRTALFHSLCQPVDIN